MFALQPNPVDVRKVVVISLTPPKNGAYAALMSHDQYVVHQ